ncbi:META domain-containing protein [Candidatus Uhrbacteria bacterium]|nr:META domain-containing protein [Candidatus Uhrbacteria bacterium]
MNKNILVVVIILIITIGFSVFYKGKNKEQVVSPAPSTAITFTSPASSEKVSVVFNEEKSTATLTGFGYTNLVLTSEVSASGARYVNKSENLELWNRGESVTLSKDGKQIFSGNIGGQNDAEKMTSAKWTWQATSEDGKVVEPKDKIAFTIAFNTGDKMVNATTDCNTIFGPYTVDSDNKLTFGSLGMTRKYCEGSQETEFASGLSKIKKFYFNESGALVLEFSSPDNYMLFEKEMK